MHVSASSSSTTSSYQPTIGVEGKWIAEEEFYGASDIAKTDPDGDHSWWDEDDELEVEEKKLDKLEEYSSTQYRSSETKQRRLWRRRRRNVDESSVEQSSPSPKQSDGDAKNNDQLLSQYVEEHPMRTDEWEFDIRLSRLFLDAQDGEDLFPECYTTDREGRSYTKLRSKSRFRKRQIMTFAQNGYVKVSVANSDNDDSNGSNNRIRPRVGKWRIGHSGVAFDIPVLMGANKKINGNNDKVTSPPKMTVLHYHADIHLNKFGERPRMFRGVITRDRYDSNRLHVVKLDDERRNLSHLYPSVLNHYRHSSFLPPNLFRPVIGTFSAEGVGHDTADTSYKTRAISLSRQQVINDAKSNNRKEGK